LHGWSLMTLNGHRDRPILLVDDDIDILDAETDALESSGFNVVSARDGAEALRALDIGPLPQVIVLDIQMPGLDGPTFARALRERLRHVPLVVVTASPDPRHEADRCNAEAYLAKPFSPDVLVETVRRFAA
jgi:CheY-like chemotaxis protein